MTKDHLAPTLLKVAPSTLSLPGTSAPRRQHVAETASQPRSQAAGQAAGSQSASRQSAPKDEAVDLVARRAAVLRRRAHGQNNAMARVLGFAAARRQSRLF